MKIGLKRINGCDAVYAICPFGQGRATAPGFLLLGKLQALWEGINA